MADPYSTLYDGVCEMLAAEPRFSELVKDGNFVRFTRGDRTPLKKNVSTADLPEVQVWVEAMGLLKSSSDSYDVKVGLSVVLVTGTYLLDHRLFPIAWAITCAMSKWADATVGLTRLQYNGKRFVKFLTMLDASVGESDTEKNRGIAGWTGVFKAEVHTMFAPGELV